MYRMARRMKELSQRHVPVVERLESRLAADEEYLLAARRIASVSLTQLRGCAMAGKGIKVLSLADFREFCEKCNRDEAHQTGVERISTSHLAIDDPFLQQENEVA